MRKKIKISILIIFLSFLLVLWFSRYYLICYSCFWMLDHTTAGPMIEDINLEIREIGNHVMPLLESTYKDKNQSQKRRAAAALAIMKADRVRAENLFMSYLTKSSSDELIAQAIYDLGRNKSINVYNDILNYLTSPNDIIRWSVVFYLGEVGTSESTVLLKKIRETDQSKKIRDAAIIRLQLLKNKENGSI